MPPFLFFRKFKVFCFGMSGTSPYSHAPGIIHLFKAPVPFAPLIDHFPSACTDFGSVRFAVDRESKAIV